MRAFRKSATLFVLGFVILPALAADRDAQGWRPSVTEAALLPKFCWQQFFGSKFKGPEFEIPRDTCGVGMNHYCPGLVLLNRATRSFDSYEKKGWLEGAEGQVLYTVRALKNYPRCPLRPEIEGTYQRIERDLRSLQ